MTKKWLSLNQMIQTLYDVVLNLLPLRCASLYLISGRWKSYLKNDFIQRFFEWFRISYYFWRVRVTPGDQLVSLIMIYNWVVCTICSTSYNRESRRKIFFYSRSRGSFRDWWIKIISFETRCVGFFCMLYFKYIFCLKYNLKLLNFSISWHFNNSFKNGA